MVVVVVVVIGGGDDDAAVVVVAEGDGDEVGVVFKVCFESGDEDSVGGNTVSTDSTGLFKVK